MSNIIPSGAQSPFDSIRHEDTDGEYWTGRTLMPVMGYASWEKFSPVITKARDSLEIVQGYSEATRHFATWGSDGGRWGNQQLADFRLTRFGAYLTAMAGDDTKEAVARARVYFAVQTREAEVRPVTALPDMTTPEGRRAVAQALLAGAEREIELTTRVAALEPKALAHDTLMAAQGGDMLVRQAAKILDWKERDLRAFLLDEKLIYRRQRTCGDWEYDFYAAFDEQFNAVKTVVEHTWGSCAHYTLHLTPRGLSFVQMRIEKRRAAMAAAIQGGAA